MATQESSGRVRLADVVSALGAELREAERRAAADDQPDLLRLKEASVELAVTWEETGSGEIDVWVFKLGGGVTKTNSETITLTLEPLATTIMNLRPEQ